MSLKLIVHLYNVGNDTKTKINERKKLLNVYIRLKNVFNLIFKDLAKMTLEKREEIDSLIVFYLFFILKK